MRSQNESREFRRSQVQVQTEVRLDNGIVLDGEGVDISLRGMRFLTEHALPVGKRVHVHVILEGGSESPHLALEARIARVESGGVALEFTTVDADSIEHLRRLVLYNASNADQVQEEIASHLGIERHG